jgi:hypothetical protein
VNQDTSEKYRSLESVILGAEAMDVDALFSMGDKESRPVKVRICVGSEANCCGFLGFANDH